MLVAAKLGGTFAAHAIWSVSDAGSDGPNFHPMLAYITEGGEQKMERLVDVDLQRAVDNGLSRLNANPMDGDAAALVYDGRMTVDNEKLDAIFVEMRVYFSPKSEAIIAVPYSPPGLGRLRVYRPKLVVWKDCADFVNAGFSRHRRSVVQVRNVVVERRSEKRSRFLPKRRSPSLLLRESTSGTDDRGWRLIPEIATLSLPPRGPNLERVGRGLTNVSFPRIAL